MGWERKRGKLHELNRLLRGATDTTFVAVGGIAPSPPSGVRYVVTLDSDTRIPIGAVPGLVGTMHHPLNRPRFDAATGRVVEGYAIMQPRVTPPLPGRAGSLFQHLMSGTAGIDPYASAVSDVYQDIFGEGTFTGKGISTSTRSRPPLRAGFPKSAAEPYLYEGIFARGAITTSKFRNTPASYTVAAARQHRWVRATAAPALAIRPGVPRSPGRFSTTMRRSLSAPLRSRWGGVVWAFRQRGVRLVWFHRGAISMTALIPVFAGVDTAGCGISKRSHVRAGARTLGTGGRAIPWRHDSHHPAWLIPTSADPGAMFVTHRKLLAWTRPHRPHAHTGALRDFARRLWAAGCWCGGCRADRWPACPGWPRGARC